jgi:hypothetical protein
MDETPMTSKSQSNEATPVNVSMDMIKNDDHDESENLTQKSSRKVTLKQII